MLVLGCSQSNGSSGGCGSSSERCEINPTAIVCGDLITLECFDGATPEAASQCALALQQETESIYCCTSAVETMGGIGDGGLGGLGGSGYGGSGVGGVGGF